MVVVRKKRSVVQTFFSTTTYTSRKVYMKSGLNGWFRPIDCMERQNSNIQGPDGKIHFINWGGGGPPAHLAHATGLCAGAYTPMAGMLRSALNVYGMDERGHGSTSLPADPAFLRDWDIFADDMAHFLTHLGQPVIAMGHSRGAVVSLMLAVDRPDLVRALVLIDPTILPYSWMWWWYLAKKSGLARYLPIVATAARRKSVWPDVQEILASYRRKKVFSTWRPDFLEAYVTHGTEESLQGSVRLCCEPAWESKCFAVCPHDIWRYVPRLKLPVLVLYGAESDTFLAPAARRFQSLVPHARFICFEKCSHFVPMEEPGATVDAIIDFLHAEAII
jgi:pimeloyl-ACP methyl ester carboxylesterase